MFTDYISESESSENLRPIFKTDNVAKISIRSKGMSVFGKVKAEKIKYFSLLIVIATSVS